jgi:hypothetical protein
VFVGMLALVGCTRSTKPERSPGDAAAKDAAATETAPANVRAGCCAQCSAAAKRDPAGMDLRSKDCRSYAGEWNGAPGVDAACVEHFAASPATVGDCWALGGDAAP